MRRRCRVSSPFIHALLVLSLIVCFRSSHVLKSPPSSPPFSFLLLPSILSYGAPAVSTAIVASVSVISGLSVGKRFLTPFAPLPPSSSHYFSPLFSPPLLTPSVGYTPTIISTALAGMMTDLVGEDSNFLEGIITGCTALLSFRL